jgi:hypothetical protein
MKLTIPESPQTKSTSKPKEMLSLEKLPNGKLKVRINFSSLSIIHDCLRKAQYSLLLNLKNETESDATAFGSAIHKALEHWYCLPENKRVLSKEDNEIADVLVGMPDIECFDALASIQAFVKAAAPIRLLGDGDKRSISNGIKILKAYFKHYVNDGLEVVRDASGKPLVECAVSFQLYEDEGLVIEFFGTIDAVMRNKITGHVMVVDHKTTAALGSQFYNRIKPNHQYTGYLWGARECLGIDTHLFMVNGIQVAKTKSEFARQTTERFEEDYQELRSAVISAVRVLLQAIESNNFPMMAPSPCTMYGTCQYLDICSSPAKLRETIIQSKYAIK